ncbi:MAG TPA: CRISPR-associated protein Csx16 [Xanthomonadaceae bacterium]|nr:CRISPR-associated protein Csx16 [Xanthomonadaceae bacterium]
MTTLFVSRHPGALDWAAGEGLAVDAVIAHLDPQTIQPGDVVIGTLPIHLAARVCERGGRYLHLSLELPPDWRGRELSAADLRRFGARLEEYRVIPIAADPLRPD